MAGKGNTRDNGVLKTTLKPAVSKAAGSDKSSKYQGEETFSSPAGSPSTAAAGASNVVYDPLPEVPMLPRPCSDDEMLPHRPDDGTTMAEPLKRAKAEIIQSTNTSIDALLSEYDKTISARHRKHEATAREHAVAIKHTDNRVDQHDKELASSRKKWKSRQKQRRSERWRESPSGIPHPMKPLFVLILRVLLAGTLWLQWSRTGWMMRHTRMVNTTKFHLAHSHWPSTGWSNSLPRQSQQQDKRKRHFSSSTEKGSSSSCMSHHQMGRLSRLTRRETRMRNRKGQRFSPRDCSMLPKPIIQLRTGACLCEAEWWRLAGTELSKLNPRQMAPTSYGGTLTWSNHTSSAKKALRPSSKNWSLARLILPIGRFSKSSPLFLDSGQSFTCVSWNSRAMLCKDRKRRYRKLGIIRRYLQNTITAVQEVHGTQAEIIATLSTTKDTHFVASSSCDSAAAGGVMTAWNRLHLPTSTTFEFEIIAPGRALITRAFFNSKTITHFNVHNDSLTPQQSWQLAKNLKEEANKSRENPDNHVVIATGDWNFASEEEHAVILNSSLERANRHHSATNQKQIGRALEGYIEFSTDQHSHYHKATNSLCNLDRSYVACPSWVAAYSSVTTKLLASPISLSEQCLSDHAPVALSWCLPSQSNRIPKAIPNWVCRSPEYQKCHDLYVKEARLDDLPDSVRWAMHKEIIIEVAAKTRNALINHGSDNAAASEALARVVLHNRSVLAAKLIEVNEDAARHLCITGGVVHFKDEKAFELELATAKTRHIGDQIDAIRLIDEHKPSKSNKEKINRLENRSKLWKAGARRAVLSAIERLDGSFTSGEDELVKELRDAWAPTFQALPDPHLQKMACDELAAFVPNAELDWKAIRPAEACEYTPRARFSKPTAPGPDTIPYSAWATDAGGKTLRTRSCIFACLWSCL
eukprot:TRINITY_DN7725_c0_g1_i7.p1 TRINITY_DN7725_c0_g1~~TRINITY_DN7725_c0_g1_i7.p1  ORF type:complete len:923 (+),score=102.57 TRINITY_DN7725_c0_g1_i7:329-3097(+)